MRNGHNTCMSYHPNQWISTPILPQLINFDTNNPQMICFVYESKWALIVRASLNHMYICIANGSLWKWEIKDANIWLLKRICYAMCVVENALVSETNNIMHEGIRRDAFNRTTLHRISKLNSNKLSKLTGTALPTLYKAEAALRTQPPCVDEQASQYDIYHILRGPYCL